MRLLRKAADLLYVAIRFIWRRLPLSWRDRVRHVCHGNHPLRAIMDWPSRALDGLWRRLPYPWRRNMARAWHHDPPKNSRPQIGEALRERLQAGPGPSVLFLPLLSWYECGFQRPHQMARGLASVGCNVIFYEPWKVGPGGQGSLKLTPDAGHERQFVGLRDLGLRLHVLRVPIWLLAEYLVQSPPDCLVMLWPYQARFIPRESSSAVVYDVVDDQDLLPGARWWRRAHQTWLRDADVVSATAERLVAKLSRIRADVLLLPNAAWPEDWTGNTLEPVPPDLRKARKAPVVIAYYGALGPWFDWEMWLSAAAARPDWAFVLLGFPFAFDEEELVRRAGARGNVFYLGAKPHTDLPRYVAHVDVATIPFKLNPITHACSPLKLFEYMAAGKPIVATAMHEILKYKSVLVAGGREAFIQRLDEAVARRHDPEYLATLKAEAEANTWQSRAQVLREAIQNARGRQSAIPRRRHRVETR